MSTNSAIHMHIDVWAIHWNMNKTYQRQHSCKTTDSPPTLWRHKMPLAPHVEVGALWTPMSSILEGWLVQSWIGLVQATIAATINPITSRGICLTAVLPIPWLWQPFHSLFCSVSQTFRGEDGDIDVTLQTGHSAVTFPLYFDQLWVSVLTDILSFLFIF